MTVLETLHIDVRGLPRPQGSMRLHRLPNGSTAARYPPGVYEWRAQVQQAALTAQITQAVERFTGPVGLVLSFDLPRPNGHYGTGRNAHVLKPSSPPWPIVAPDFDKLTRCIGDALTDAGIWRDDAQVVTSTQTKRYVQPPEVPGVQITVRELLRPPELVPTARDLRILEDDPA